MMAPWRDVAAMLLLVHLMALSDGLNVDGNGAVDEVLSKNLSAILVDGKADSHPDTNIANARPFNSAYDNDNDKGNDSVVLKAAMTEDIKILESELEEAIEGAALSGHVILLSPPANGTNSSTPSMIIIETPADVSRSATTDKLIDGTIEEPSPNLDQEIAQSQNHEHYEDNGNSENLEDLLAIAEYEPQRIDARIEEKNPQVSSEQVDFAGRPTAIRPPAEETHYDVPKRKEYPKNVHRISDQYRSTTTKPDLKVSSTGQVQRSAAPPKLDQFAIERQAVKDRSQFSTPSTFYHHPTAVPAKFSDAEANPKVEIASRAKTSIPPKFTYALSRYVNSLAAPKPADAKSTPEPGYPRKIDAPPRTARNLIDTSESLKRINVPSSRAKSAEVSSPSSSYRSSTEYETSGRSASSDSSSPTSGTARASRRVDDGAPARYVETPHRGIQPLTNEQLGFLTRYNLPSLVAGKFASSRSHPVPARNSRAGSAGESRAAENRDDERGGFETRNPRSGTLIPGSDSYEANGRENTDGKRVDRPYGGRNSDPIRPSVYPYAEVGEETAPRNHRVENTARQRNGNQPLSSTTPVYDDYDVSPKPKPVRPKPIAPKAPSQDFYIEDYKESSSSKSARDSPLDSYEDYRESAESSKMARNDRLSLATPREDYGKIGNSKILRKTPTASGEDYQESENSKISRASPVASYEDYRVTEDTEVLKNSPIVSRRPYDFYADYEESDGRSPLPHPQRLIIAEPPQRVPPNSRLAPIQPRPVLQPTPVNLSNNPTYKLHGLKSASLPVNGVYNPSVSYSLRKPSIVVPPNNQNIQAPREASIDQRVTYTTPVYDSEEDNAQANRPSLSPSRVTNRNQVANRPAKPIYNGDDERPQSASATPITKNSEKFYRDRGVSVSPVNALFTLPSQEVPQLRGSPRRASTVSGPDRVDDSSESLDRGVYASDTGTDYRNRRPSEGPRYREGHNQGTGNAESAASDSRENGDRDVSSTSNRAKSIEPHSDYGSRIGSRVVEDRRRDRTVEPPSTRAFATTAGERGTGRKASPSDGDERGLAGRHVDEVPVESVNRESVGDSSDYEDEVPASSGHEEKHENYKTHEEAKNDGGEEYKHEEGGGLKHKEDHHVSHGEKGEKGYKEWHEHDEGEKGHHDKESHDKEYDEKKGEKKKHEEESDYHKEHHHEEKGEKEAEFGEKGEHQKGHSTKGQHVVHKKDEYEKKTEFYDESHEEDGEEKEGGYGEEHEYEKGGHEKIGHHDSGHHEDKYGKKGEHEKGHHYHEHEGHKDSKGHDEHHHHEEKYGKKGGHEEGNKWSHEKGDNGKKSS